MYIFAVTPYAGVWIEILLILGHTIRLDVTPYVGVWIEIVKMIQCSTGKFCHSQRGSVDWRKLWKCRVSLNMIQ